MWRLTLRGVRAHKLRYVLTTLAVVLGVGFVVGAFVVTDSLRSSVDGLFRDISAGVDVSVRERTNVSTKTMAAVRGRIPETLLPAVRAVPGVRVAEGVVGGYAQLLDKQGKPVTTTGAPLLGVSWGESDELSSVTLFRGRKPVADDEIAIDRGMAEDYHYAVGDRVVVLLASGARPTMTIVGTFTFGEANNLLGARVTAFSTASAQRLLGSVGAFAWIDVAIADGETPSAVAARIQAVMPPDVEAVSQTQVVDESSGAFSGFVNVFEKVLLGFALVAVFVAVFFVNNTYSIIVGQRTKEFALLRALGASERQVTTAVAGEALAAGAVASALGIGFGMLIARAIEAILSSGGLDLPGKGIVLTGRTLAAALVVGVGVTLVAAVMPARRAARIPPVAGMRDNFVPSRWSGARRTVLAGALGAVGVALLAAGLWADLVTALTALCLAAGALFTCLAAAEFSPLLARPFVENAGRPVAPLFGFPGRLAKANAARSPDRTAKTASALMVGLAMVSGAFVIGTSMKRTFTASLDQSVRADYLLSTDGQQGFSPAVTAALAARPEFDAVSGIRTGPFLFDGANRTAIAVVPSAAEKLVDISMVSGRSADLGPDTILIHQDPARDRSLHVRDPVTIEMATGGPRTVRIAGIYADATWAGNYLIDLATFERYNPTSELDLMAFLHVAPGVTKAAAAAAIDTVVADQPQVKVEDRAGFRARQAERMDQLLLMVNALLGLALFIALLGIANTLALSVLERTREIGLLRAVGMRRGQTRAMVLAEAAVVTLFGALLGVAIGIGLGAIAAAAMPDTVVKSIALPWAAVVQIVIAATVCGVLAGWLPARRAVRLDVLRSIAME